MSACTVFGGGDASLPCGGGGRGRKVGGKTKKLIRNLRGQQPRTERRRSQGQLRADQAWRQQNEAAGMRSQVTFVLPVKVPYVHSGQASFSGWALRWGPVVSRGES